MNINIKATNIELTDAIRDYAEKKIGAIEKYIDEKRKQGVLMIEVGKMSDHHKQGEIFFAEVRGTGAGLNFFARSESENLYAAIDKLENEARRELTSEKGKHIQMLRSGQRALKDMMRGFPWMGKK